jgi:hypothetical protein
MLQPCYLYASAPLELCFSNAVYALSPCYLHSSAPLKHIDSILRVMLQQNGGTAIIAKLLIISDLIKPLKFTLFSAEGKLFHFKANFSVKKLVSSLHFCPKSGVWGGS